MSRRLRASTAAVVCLGVFAVSGCGGVTPVRTAFNRGVYQSSQNNPAGAVREFRAALEEDPGDYRARFNLGCALEDLAAARRAEAARADAAARRAETLGKSEAKSEAEARAVELRRAAAADRAEARAQYERLLVERPGDLRAAANLSALDFEDAADGDATREAAAVARLEALAATAGHPLPARTLAARRLEQGRLAEARAYAQRALAVESSDPETHFLLGRIDEAEGRFDAALARFDRVLVEIPDDVAALLAAGEVSRKKAAAAAAAGDADAAAAARREALVRYRRAAMVRRDVFPAHLALGELEAEAGDDEAAVAHLLAARRLDDLRTEEPRPEYERRLAILYERLAAAARAKEGALDR